MKFKSISIIALLISSVLFTQCKKDSNEEVAPTTPTTTTATVPTTVAQIFAQNGVQAATGQANMSISQNTTLSGVKITIPSNSFITSTGALVTGTIDLAIKGIFTKKDIILTGAPANAAGKLIATKGCIKISASQNSQTLRLAPGSNVTVNIPEPGTPVTGLKKFYAQQISVSDSTKIWRLAADSASIVAVLDSATMTYSYPARVDSVAWLNTGYIWDTIAQKTTVTVILDSTFTATNCTVYISLNGKLVVGAMYSQGMGYYSINNIPIGIPVNFVVIATKNGSYYSNVTAATIINNHSQTITPQATTLSAIQSALTLLP